MTLEDRVGIILYILLQILCKKTNKTEIYYIDSKKVPVYDNLRIASHRVFKEYAGRGKSSTGWFYGFKVHLVINNWGEIVSFDLSAGNRADNSKEILEKLLSHLKGICLGDKGYLTKLWENFYEKGLKIVHKIKKNMKNKLLSVSENYYLAKRGIIESVNDILDSVFDLTHSRHRKPTKCVLSYFLLSDRLSVLS